MGSSTPLGPYEAKRDFAKTREPRGGAVGAPRPAIFVVQKHAARRLHYDVRLEAEGVLKSWAVPEGPAVDPKRRRLAVQTEDHPLAYATFEGVIPKGEYGGGTVIVWDRGHYAPIRRDGRLATTRKVIDAAMRDGLARGRLRIALKGERLNGVWNLVKMGGRHEDDAWLLIRSRDQDAGPDAGPDAEPVARHLDSVLTQRTIEDVQAQEGTPDEVARQMRSRTMAGSSR